MNIHPLNYLAKYVTTTDGAADMFGVVETGLEFVKKVPLKLKQMEFANKVQKAANVAGNALVFSDVISDVNNLRSRYSFEKGTSTIKEFFLDVLYLIGDVAKASLFVNEIADLGRKASGVNGIYNGSYLLINSMEAKDKFKEIKQNKKIIERSNSQLEKNYLSHKNNLKSLKIGQKVSSIALSIFGLGSLFFGFSITGAGLIPAIVLTFSTSYLILHITNYFYGKVIKDNFRLN